MSDYIKNMSDERLREKLDYWLEQQLYWERNAVNHMFNANYKKACNNYQRYLREWARRMNK